MKKYNSLALRYYKFFKYLRTIAIVSFVIFLIVSAFNRGQEILTLINYFAILVTLSCLLECVILYILYLIFRNK